MKKLLILPIVLILITSCIESSRQVPFKHDEATGIIDTIDIRGNRHEVIKYNRGIMHSPECDCKKEEAK